MPAARVGTALVAFALSLIPVMRMHAQENPRVTVTPVDELTALEPVAATTYQAQFTIAHDGAEPLTFSLACVGVGVVRCEGVSPAEVRIPPGGAVSVVVTFATAEAGGGLVALTAFSPATLARAQARIPFRVRPAPTQP